jgi:hypothetical protein
MPRRRKAGTSESLGGKLAGFRREVERVMESLRREIAVRESELSELKAEYGKVMEAFAPAGRRGAVPPASPEARPSAGRARRARARALDWKKVYASLPPRFTLDVLSAHPKAGKRSKPHLYAIISRWKKEKKIAKDAGGGYRKVEAGAKAGRGSGRKTPGTPKVAASAKAAAAKTAGARQESPAA